VIFDAIKRYLVYKGFEVTWVVNITDVDDKLIDAAAEEKSTLAVVAQKYTKDYLDCLALLGVDTIDRFPKASEHMGEIVEMTKQLIGKEHAYAAEGNVWFDVASDADYGKLSHRHVDDQEAGTRTIEGAGKRNPADFALWKAAKPGEPSWDSPWGKGRPGWHIECSAMSTKYLGQSFDIHGGGMDLLFPHHENELAQSECATGAPFAKFWLHNGLTKIKTKLPGGEVHDVKMSKTLGNVIDPRVVVAEHGSDLVRYLLLSTHYRSPIDFSPEVLAAAKKGLAVFGRLFERVERISGQPLVDKGADMDQAARDLLESEPLVEFVRSALSFKMKFLEMMDDDFNTAGAIAVLHELAGQANAFIERHGIERDKQPERVQATIAAAQTLRNLGQVLGLFRQKPAAARGEDSGIADKLMQLLIQLRNDARKSKNFALADAVRKGLTEIGITLEDRADGTIWRKE
jgi:cysteinyl-tRNA synthetase